MLGDGKTSYDVGNDGDKQSIGGCSANFRRTNVATKLKITYVKNNFLDVKIQYKAWDDWSDCMHLKNVALPDAPYLGFSAMTGDVSDAHDIITVNSYSAVLAQAEPKKKSSIFSTNSKPRVSDAEAPKTWLAFFFKLFLIAGVCAGGYYGYLEYQRRKLYGGATWADTGGFGGSYSNHKRF
jgi:mannose-binding lectin 2